MDGWKAFHWFLLFVGAGTIIYGVRSGASGASLVPWAIGTGVMLERCALAPLYAWLKAKGDELERECEDRLAGKQ